MPSAPFQAGLIAVFAEPGHGDLVIDLKMALWDTCLLQVLIDLLKPDKLAKLYHFLLALLLYAKGIQRFLPLLAQQVDRGLDCIPPIRLRIAFDGHVVGWPILHIALLVDGHSVPSKELWDKLDVFQHLLVQGQCDVTNLYCSRADWDVKLRLRGQVCPELYRDVRRLDQEHIGVLVHLLFACIVFAHEYLHVAAWESDGTLCALVYELATLGPVVLRVWIPVCG